MTTYGVNHQLQPKQCAANVPTWTDTTLTANSTKVRKAHIDGLRTAINNELSRRGINQYTWTDPTVTANSTKVKKSHIDDLRAGLDRIHNGECGTDIYYCPQDSLACASADLTDGTITANSTKVKNTHFSELRTKVATLMASCICEAEYCQYCADCGYYYNTCSHAGCHCDDHKYNECMYALNHYYICGSTNLSSVTTNPYRIATTGGSATAWNGTLPWAMCNYTPPGVNWGSCEHQGGHDHTAWNCKCNPFTWP